MSVVIPTYNHRNFIRSTLDSVFAQTFEDYEVIVVDDGSPDDTAEVLAPLADAGRIRLIRQANAGQAAARNRGIDEARGTYIALLDDDDLWPADKLAVQVNAFEPEDVLVYGDVRRFRDDGLPETDPPRTYPTGDVLEAFLRENYIVSPGQTLIRRDALRRVGGFDRHVWGSDDWDLYLRLARLGPVCYVPHVALRYRLHEGNASRHAARHAANHMKVALRHIGLRPGLLLASQRSAAGYFVPNLVNAAHAARRRGDYAKAAAALLWTLPFRPSLLLRSGHGKRLAKDLVRAATG
ncbi:MAG: glycosyltransferase family 2 protein [Phycisphaerae bacterium]